MASILALDPGVTTGWATYKEDGDVVTGQFKGTHHQFWTLLSKFAPDVIVFEGFVYQRRHKVVLYPVEVIGIIKLYAEVKKVIELQQQTASQAKNLWTMDKLKKLGLWKEAQVHAMDATRHLLYYLVVTRGDRSWLENLRPDRMT